MRSAAVHGAIRKALKPILIAAAAQYAALMALLVPVKILLRIVSARAPGQLLASCNTLSSCWQ